MPKPYYFVSYSSREKHVENLLDALRLVLSQHFDQRLTPAALKSGESQRERILSEMAGAAFGVVILDGLRPNVVFEYGIMVGMNKSVLLFMEESAEVDVPGFYPEETTVPGERTVINLNSQFSDIADIHWTKWYRFKPEETRRVVWEEYKKMAKENKDLPDIEPTG